MSKVKKSKLLLISSILGALYAIYIVLYFSGVVSGSSSDAESVGSAIATILVLPHILLTIVAVIFNIIGYAKNSRGFTLTAAILYAVAGVMFFIYALFILPSMILSFVGYSKLKEINETNKQLAS
jgi:Zn-dependent protease with chaperone function